VQGNQPVIDERDRALDVLACVHRGTLQPQLAVLHEVQGNLDWPSGAPSTTTVPPFKASAIACTIEDWLATQSNAASAAPRQPAAHLLHHIRVAGIDGEGGAQLQGDSALGHHRVGHRDRLCPSCARGEH